MKIKALVALLYLFPVTARAQFTPLCDNGMGTPVPCMGFMDQKFLPSIPAAKLPVVPTTRGGTGNGAGVGENFVFSGPLTGSGDPTWKPLSRSAISGIAVDFSKTAQPMIEVVKDLGTGPQMIGRFPGDGGTFNRWYVGQRGMFMTFNCSTPDGVTCIKDSTAITSSVLEMNGNSLMRWSFDTSAAISTWRTDMAQRSTEWRGGAPVWTTELGNGWITAMAGGTVRASRIGDVVHFPVQWPTRLKRAPTKFIFGPSKVVGTPGALSVTNADENGAVLNVDVGSAGDFTWVGQVHASN